MPKTAKEEFPPLRAAGLLRLQGFVPRAGRRYREERNFDRGENGHRSVSGLSPYLRHRLLSETEVLSAVLEQHSRRAADKFIQEVMWRGYWKGWLEQRPWVWQEYLDGVAEAERRLTADPDLENRHARAVSGDTGIVPFDSWARELVGTGYLHNHARMWFASIWIFTLKLPWALGADFFYRYLLDGDPASNTLSWRWVAGMHTRGKTYLATEKNIRRYAAERFDMDGSELGLGQLSTRAVPPEAPAHAPAVPLAWPEVPEAADRVGLLLTEEDLETEWPVRPSAIAALHTDQARRQSDLVRSFKTGALQDALTRAGGECPGADLCQRALPLEEAVAWAKQNRMVQLWVAYAPVGPVREQLSALEPSLADAGIRLVRFTREHDRLVWPLCDKGFFQLRKRIPDLLDALLESPPGLRQPSLDGV